MIARTLESDSDQADGRESGAGPKSLSQRVRGLVSVLLALHLVAIASAPLAMDPASLPAQKVFAVFRPYLDAAFLNHGYHFFAPEPGPSHLIRYELSFSDGRVEGGVFPDPAEQQPRLNYHRHFMLTEFASQLAVTESQQPVLHKLSRSFARHLMTEQHAESVTLFLRRHYIPSPQQVQMGMTLDSEELYAERPLGMFLLDESPALTGESFHESPSGKGPIVERFPAARLTGELQSAEVTR
ncbi:MAG: hypothetical protein O3B13_22560 [Planctomycetota bacterium]|nr:hypothetical protein [Planctomycetota bacterium]